MNFDGLLFFDPFSIDKYTGRAFRRGKEGKEIRNVILFFKEEKNRPDVSDEKYIWAGWSVRILEIYPTRRVPAGQDQMPSTDIRERKVNIAFRFISTENCFTLVKYQGRISIFIQTQKTGAPSGPLATRISSHLVFCDCQCGELMVDPKTKCYRKIYQHFTDISWKLSLILISCPDLFS